MPEAEQSKAEVAARAAYRLGLATLMLAMEKDEENNFKLPGIFRQQLEGEKSYRELELRSAGVDPSCLDDLGFRKEDK